MIKLRIIRLYKVEDVPDHLVQEVEEVVNKMGKHLTKAFEGHDVSILLSAMNRFHAGMIVHCVTENGLKEAAQTEAIGLIRNVEHISGQNIFQSQE